MKVTCIGGGPGGLYFALLLKKANPAHEITVIERNRPADTFGFGVVFSDATLDKLAQADPESYQEITRSFEHWDDIDIHYNGKLVQSTGHGFNGLGRLKLLEILYNRCREFGVKTVFRTEVTDLEPYKNDDLIVASDGANSFVRTKYAEQFETLITHRPNKFVWLGSTKPFQAFTFYFKHDRNGLWRVHAYRYEKGTSTFIVETTDAIWKKAGLENATEDDTLRFCENLFAGELEGHKLLKNRSLWRSFPTISNSKWHYKNIVLIGDAAHTVHFSVGSGTKLAMEDAIALVNELKAEKNIGQALAEYEKKRRPEVESLQRAAQMSLQWFEETERYMNLDPLQFSFSLLTRSLRITHKNLKMRDPKFIGTVDNWFAKKAVEQSGVKIQTNVVPPPMFTPFRIRDMALVNRVVVSPMCMYSAEDGTVNEWHLVHLGSRAVGGAGLVVTELTDVSRQGRISLGCAGMYKDEHISEWKKIVDFVHKNSYAKIAIQLGHAGRKGSTKLAWEGIDEPMAEGNWPIISASPIPYFPQSQSPKEMEKSDMEQVKSDFVRAVKMSDEAGFDMIELHFAHGYLLSSFISPLTNTRKDEYGGSLENRMRFPLEVLDAIRQVWPQDKPLSIRISATDWAPGGIEPQDAVEIAKMLKAHNCDIVDVSAGQTVPYAKPVYGRQFQTPFSDRIRHEAGIYTMAVGNITSYEDVNSILAAGRADLCVLARAHLWDPYWTRHAAYDQGYTIPWPAQYSSLERFTPRF